MKKTGLAIAVVVAGSFGAEVLTLPEAQALLLGNNLDIAAARVQVQRAEAAAAEARGSFFPSIDASGSYTYVTERPQIRQIITPTIPGAPPVERIQTIGTNHNTQFGLDLSYPLFTGFTRYRTVASRNMDAAAGRERLDAIRNSLSLALGLLYLQWEFSYKQIETRQVLVEQLDTYAQQTAKRREAGVTVQSTLLQAQARLELAKADLVAANNQSDSLRLELLSFIRAADSAAKPDTVLVELDTVSLPASVDTVRPEIRALDNTIAGLAQTRSAIRGQKLPSVLGTAGYRYANPGQHLNANEFMGYGLFGVQLKWNLFDGLRNRQQAAQIARQIDLVGIQRKQQIDFLERSFEAGREQVQTASARLAAAKSSLAAAYALSRDLNEQLSAGTVTVVDYLNALTGEAQARLAVEQARMAKRMAILRTLYAAGTPIVY